MINPAVVDEGQASTTTKTDSPRTIQGRGNASRFSIAGDKIAAATADLPDRERDAIRWAAGYCRAKNISCADFAARLRKPDGTPYSADSVYHMFTGGREADQLGNIVAAIEAVQKIEEERGAQRRVTFIETQLSRRIWAICRRALDRGKLVLIYGDSQIGKTTSLVAFQRKHNHGRTIYVRMPPGGSFDSFIRELAQQLGIPAGSRTEELRRRIIECFDDRMLLIVDECEECLANDSGNRGVKTLNFIREIYDKTGCGVVLAGANVFKHRLERGPHASGMQRLLRRALAPLQLPNVPPPADLAVFATAYGLPEIEDRDIGVRVTVTDESGVDSTKDLKKNPLTLQTEVIAKHGLGRWLNILMDAADTAREKRRPVTWGIVIHAWHQFEADTRFAEQFAAKSEEEAA